MRRPIWSIRERLSARVRPRSGKLARLLVLAVVSGFAAWVFLPPPTGLPRAAPAPIAQVSLSMTPVAEISPLIYGVNYVWDSVPAEELRQFDAAMRSVARYTLARYPGGWAAEWYDWAANREVGGRAYVERPGPDPASFLSVVPQASFIVPSAAAIRDPSQIPVLARYSADLVRRYGGRVTIWEIGNEWWMQRGAQRNPFARQQNLATYAALVAAVAPAMKAANPHIDIYATGDWVEPQEFRGLRDMVGAAWSSVDGISIHTYCGELDPERLCSQILQRADTIRSVTGKTKLYDSEWARARRINAENYGMRNAYRMMDAIQDLAMARMTAAAYWPPTKAVPAIAFVSDDLRQAYATGAVFGWMSQYYRGQALRVSGELPAAAARSGATVTLFIAADATGHRIVRVPLAGTGLERVASAEVMFGAEDPRRSWVVEVASLPTTLRGGALELELNPGTPGRGAGWEFARVTLD